MPTTSPLPINAATSSQHRQDQIERFLQAYFDTPYTIKSLAGDASFRRYHRIIVGDDSYLLMDAPPDKESVESFVEVANFLAPAINVPTIFSQNLADGLLLLQDFGTLEFAEAIACNDNKMSYYKQAFAVLKQLQSLPTDTLEPYSAKILYDEMALFSDWFVPYVATQLDAQLWQTLSDSVVACVLAQPQVVVHRDFHSRNLMVTPTGLGVIDFQDALVGAYSYDIVSLLRDAYIDFGELWVQDALVSCYELGDYQHRLGKSLEGFLFDVAVMGVQRHLKVLGIFVRLYQRDDKQRYLAYLPKVANDLSQCLSILAYQCREPIWGQFLAWWQNALNSTDILTKANTKRQ